MHAYYAADPRSRGKHYSVYKISSAWHAGKVRFHNREIAVEDHISCYGGEFFAATIISTVKVGRLSDAPLEVLAWLDEEVDKTALKAADVERIYKGAEEWRKDNETPEERRQRKWREREEGATAKATYYKEAVEWTFPAPKDCYVNIR